MKNEVFQRPPSEAADAPSWRDRYRLLREVGELLLSEIPDDELLKSLADRIVKASAADGAVLARVSAQGDPVEVVTARSYLVADIAKPVFEVSRTLIKRAVLERQPVFVADALDLPEASRSRSMKALRVLSVIALPLQAAPGEAPFAVLYLDRRRPGRLFEAADLEALSDVMSWANRTLGYVLAARAARKSPTSGDRGGIVGGSAAIREVLAFVERAARTDANVLVRGATGTGKELVAQLLHQRSAVAAGPFVAINCAAIPNELLESELFGHEAGTFTGALARRVGRMQEAAGGTLFLDEIGDMPLALQAKILRVVETRTFRVLGGKELPLKARILSATHQPLERLAKAGRFREDLYFRLAVLQVELPPLSKRRDDIVEIAEHVIASLCRLRGRVPPRLTRSARTYLARRAYPGNVRELSHLLERALLWVDGPSLDRADLSSAEQGGLREEEEAPLTAESFRAEKERMVRELEQRFVARLLRAHGGNVAAASRAAGLSEVYVYRLLKRHSPRAGGAEGDAGDDEDGSEQEDAGR